MSVSEARASRILSLLVKAACWDGCIFVYVGVLTYYPKQCARCGGRHAHVEGFWHIFLFGLDGDLKMENYTVAAHTPP